MSFIFWDITSCSQVKVNQRFGRTCFVSTFRVKEYAKQETSMQAGGMQAVLVTVGVCNIDNLH
jgi:hypothetical protein